MNIIITDDDPIVRTSLKTICEAGGLTVVALGGDGPEVIRLYREYRPDVLLMDIRMGAMTGIEAGKEILSANPDAKILFLTTFSDDEYIVAALKMGARGYILKQNFETIVPSLEAVAAGSRVFGDEVVTRLTLTQSVSVPDLSDKENEIIRLVADGLSNREIADKLFLSEGTVRNYLSAILDKLSLRDRTQLAIFYYKNLR